MPAAVQQLQLGTVKRCALQGLWMLKMSSKMPEPIASLMSRCLLIWVAAVAMNRCLCYNSYSAHSAVPALLLLLKAGDAHCIPDIQEAPGLASLAIHCEGMSHCCLHNKSVEGCAKDAVVVISVDQLRVCCGLFSGDTIHNALHSSRQV